MKFLLNRIMFLLFAMNFFCFSLPAQDARLNNPVIDQQSFTNMTGREPSTISASPVSDNNIGYDDGSAFLYPTWHKGLVIFKNKSKFECMLRFDLVKNQLQFFNSGKPNLFAEPVLCFFLYDSSEAPEKTYYFQSSYPPFGQQKSSSFYQVVCFGSNVHFIKYISKKPEQVYVYGSTSKSVLKTREEWFIYDTKENKLKFVSPTANSVQKALQPYLSDVKGFSLDKHKSISEEEMILLCNNANKTKGT